MSASFIRLVLVFPPALETALTDALTTGASLPGFTLLHAEGHSGDFAHASPAEQVRGRIERRVVWVVIETMQLEPVLAQLRQHVPSREVRWWTESVLQQGRLG